MALPCASGPRGRERGPKFCRIAGTLIILGSVALAACAHLPKTRTVVSSVTLTDTAETRLGRASAMRMSELHGAQSGIHLLPRGPDAFLARLALVEAADKSLDLQYFIWSPDMVGKLLMAAVLRAADRGVRVRILIDDIGSMAKDETLLVIDQHPNIEVRLFNPAANRSARNLWKLTDLSRVNRRMHNKSFTADNRVTIVGGRNIGDEYFEASAALDFADLDALVIGSAVSGVSARFDRYWNSPVVYGISELHKHQPTSEDRTRIAEALREFENAQRGQSYTQAMRDSQIAQEILAGRVVYQPATISVKADDPIKVEKPGADPSKNLMRQLAPEFGEVRDSLILVSPYFVPRKAGVQVLRDLRARGVQVTVVTNGLGSTDVPPVFAKYKKYRRPLLEAGVKLYEVNPAAGRNGSTKSIDTAHGGNAPATADPPTALHGKILVFDCHEFFVGSMNLDPRSAMINTEVGLLVDSSEVARQLCGGLDEVFPLRAYRLELRKKPDGGTRIEWIRVDQGREERLTEEPRTSSWQRFKSWLYSLLPIESQM